MNITQAQHLLEHAGQLVQLTATFAAHYGSQYELCPGSPEDAWELYDAIQAVQAQIASGLDSFSWINAHHRCGEWWERQDVMDVSVALAISYEVNNLIACCATHEAKPSDVSYSVQNAQLAIAGMIHPAALQMGEAARQVS